MNSIHQNKNILNRILEQTKAKSAGENQWTGHCPAHGDSNASLSIGVGKDGRILLNCFAGCDKKNIYSALDIKSSDLFPTNKKAQPNKDFTLASFAHAKGFDAEYLEKLGIKECRNADKKTYIEIPYKNINGQALDVVRKRYGFTSKDGFGWKKGISPTKAGALYGAERLPGYGWVVFVEGESDSWTIWKYNIPAVGVPGANMAGVVKEYHVETLKRIFIFVEPDEGGKAFLKGVRERLKKIGWEGKLFFMKLDGFKDPNDLHQRDPENFKTIFEEALKNATPIDITQPDDDDEDEGTGSDDKKKTTTDLLLELTKDINLFHDPDDRCYATIEIRDHSETYPIRSAGFRKWLIHQYYIKHRASPHNEALQSALKTLEAIATFEGPEIKTYIRVAGYDDRIYIDLANDNWEAIEVTSTGWKAISNPPVKFLRPSGMESLPYPIDGNALEIQRFINVKNEKDLYLIIAFIVGAYKPTGPYLFMTLLGEQGTAKSTTARIIRKLVDPNTMALRSSPRSEQDLMIATRMGWIVSFDNLSGLPVWLSDALCRISTGGGFATRTLYTNEEETRFTAMRPVILNGISDVVARPDLLERSLIVTLEPIPETARLSEEELWKSFDAAQAGILGGLYDAISAGLRNHDDVKLPRLPRMADFARWVTACEPGLGLASGAFMRAYDDNQTEAIESNLESCPVAQAMRSLLEYRGEWTGTASKLLDELEAQDCVTDRLKRSKQWPQNGRALSTKLARLATFLRKIGIDIEKHNRKNRSRMWHLEKACNFASPPSPASPFENKILQTTDNTGLIEMAKGDANGDAKSDGDANAPKGDANAGGGTTHDNFCEFNELDKKGDASDASDAKKHINSSREVVEV